MGRSVGCSEGRGEEAGVAAERETLGQGRMVRPTSSASSITQGISPAAENALAFQRSVPEKLSPKQPVFLNERSFSGGAGSFPSVQLEMNKPDSCHY